LITAREAPDRLPLARDAANARWLEDDECVALKREPGINERLAAPFVVDWSSQ
jgi:hypothetical protein